MSLPFTALEFFDVFRRYNDAVWPMQIVLTALGVAAVVLLALRRPGHERALVILLAGVYGARLRYEIPRDRRAVLGAALIAYGLAVYPLLSLWLGAWPEAPTFGLPCPTTIFTVGVLCFLRAPFPRYVFLVPLLWSVVGSSAIVQCGLLQDLGLAVAGLVALRLMIRWHGTSKAAYA